MLTTIHSTEVIFKLNSFEKERVLLERLVNIDSRSGQISGVQKVIEIVKDELLDMGFVTSLIPNPTHASADLLVGVLPGCLPYQVAFVSHADTVLGPTDEHFFYESTSESKLFGPGVADNKGGIAVALRGLRQYLSHSTLRPSLLFVCSPNEEVGSLGFHSLFEKFGNESAIVLGFEPALKNGDLIKGRHGNRWYRIKIKGIPFHAGRFGEPSLNAAHEAAYKTVRLSQLNDVKNRIKVNVGTVSGGSGHFNIVCGDVELLVDVRFPCHKIRDQLHDKIIEILETPHVYCEQTNAQCEVSYTLDDDCPSMGFEHDSNGPVLDYLNSIYLAEAKASDISFTGGAADINYFSMPSNFCLDGLGPIAGGMHTTEEYILADSLYTRSNALTYFLESLGER